MKKFMIVDGNSIMNRAFYGVRPLITKDGLQTGAVYGYTTILKKHLDNISPDYAAVAFDVKAPTFRHKMYGDYKGTRKGMPEELAVQLPYIKRMTEALGLAVIEKAGFEADDILGTMSAKFEAAGCESYIITGDRDSLQLASDSITVVLASVGNDEYYTPEKVKEKYSLPPSSVVDIKALAGDSSDNIPGVAGVGEKTAIKLLLDADGSVEKLFEKLDSGELAVTKGLFEKLTSGRESAKLSYALAKIDVNVPDLPQPESLEYKGFCQEKLVPLFGELEFTSFFERFGVGAKKEEELICELCDIKTAELCEHIEKLNFASLSDTLYILSDKAYKITDFSEETLRVIKEKQAGLVVLDLKDFAHKLYDMGLLEYTNLVKFDVLLAAYLDNPENKIDDLEKASLIYLDKSAQGDEALHLARLRSLYEVLKDRLEDMRELYYKIEMPLAVTLAKMEKTGFGINAEELTKYGEKLKAAIAALEGEIYTAAGCEFNINSPKQLGEVLFNRLNLPVIKKKKSGFSTDAETLSKLRPYSPIIDAVLGYRKLSKLYGTYVEGLLKQIADDGRIHTCFNQRLTQTGRLSSNEPNLQNIPVRTEEGREFRKFFTAKEGYVLIDADYSQIELRILAHLSGDKNLIEAFRAGNDIHAITASEIFGVPIGEVTADMRKSAKAVNFGIVYGIGEFSLAEDIGVPIYEAKNYIERYFATYPGVREYMTDTVRRAEKDGFVTTIYNRRRYIPELTGTKKMLRAFGERVAMNTPVQGSAADIIKLAMVNIDKRLEGHRSQLILQVHDELIVEAPLEEAEEVFVIVKEEMEKVCALDVLLEADVGMGKTWYEAKK